jgi:hypothetical protein
MRRLFFEPLEVRNLLTAAPFGSGEFVDSGQALGSNNAHAVKLGDLDGDGDLDAFIVNARRPNQILLSDSGVLTDSGQLLGSHNSLDAALGDLDGDGDIDAIVANAFQGDQVWMNEGGVFTRSGPALGKGNSTSIELGDLDGDGDLDAFVASRREGNRVWLNDGGQFADSGQSLGGGLSYGVSLGDLDGDGDLDAFVANVVQGNRVWLNHGGVFADSNQSLGFASSFDVSLGDLDSDGDLDAFVANFFQGNTVWENDGGEFSNTGQALGSLPSAAVSLSDLDADGDLDAFIANSFHSNRVWLNDGGKFSDSGQSIGGSSSSEDVAIGDLDGDGDNDALTANGREPNRLWLDPLVTVTLFGISAAAATGAEGDVDSQALTFTVTRSGDPGNTAAVLYIVEGNGVNPADAADFGGAFPAGIVSFSPNESSRTITINATGDEWVEGDEGFTVTLSNPTPSSAEITTPTATGTILNDDTTGLANPITALPENTDTAGSVRIADIVSAEGSDLTLAGADSANFEIVDDELRLLPGVELDFESEQQFDVSVQVNQSVQSPGAAISPHRQGNNVALDPVVGDPTQ